MIGEGVADLVQRGREAGLADDVRRTAGQLGRQEVQFAGREDLIVRQDQERPLLIHQALQEFCGPGEGVLFANEDAVHVGEPALRC